MTSYLFVLLSLTINCQIAQLPNWAKQRFVLLSETFERSSQLNPSFIEYDLNGDDILDVAIFVTKKLDGKTGVLFLINGEGNQLFIAGAGNTFGPGGDDYKWADSWQVYDKKMTYEMSLLLNGDIGEEREVILKNSAISIREDEGSGGLIYLNGDEFIWIHQGD